MKRLCFLKNAFFLRKKGTISLIRMAVTGLAAILIVSSASDAAIDNLDIGGDLMTQYFFGDNFDLSDSLNDETDFFRLEAHLWFQADLDDNITTRISFEVDRALESYNIGNTNNLRSSGVGDLEIFLEEAFIKVARVGGSGFSFSAGRQFLNFGDNPDAEDFNRWWGPGFIIADSQSDSPLLLTQLGSYEIDPFDAVVLTHETEHTSVDIIHARDVEDSVLGVNGTDADAYMWGIYGSYYGVERHQLDLYATFNDQNGPTGSIGFDGDRWVVGGRVAGDISESLAYKAELAYQSEDQNRIGARDADALGAQVGVNYHPELKYNPNIGFIYSFLEQGGAPGSMTGFSAPFEGKTYGLIAEGLVKTFGGFNPFTNMHVFNLNGGLQPWQRVAWRFDLHYLLLQERLTASGDRDTGLEFNTQMDYQFNDYLTTFLGGGVFFPGEATEDVFGSDDNAFFFRAGMKVHF